MRRITTALALMLTLAVTALAQQPSLEDELRAEIARLKEQVVRAEALLARVEKEQAAASPALPAPTASPASPVPPSTAPAQVAEAKPAPPSPPRRAPALNTPPKLPASAPENYRKNPPRFDVLLQTRYDHFADTTRNNTFFLRKAELGVKGHIVKNVDFSLELDPVRTNVNDPYRRTYVRLTHLKRLHMKFGLEKAPIGLDELTPTAQVAFVDRSEVSDRFSAAEELGVHFESNWDQLMLQASLTNGGRRLYRDDNRSKDFTARAVWGPTHNFSLGAATLQGKAGPEKRDRIRYNVESRYGTNLQGIQGEFFRAKDAGVWSSAFYLAGFWAQPVKKGWLTHVQPVARYEYIERGDNDPQRELRLLTFGVSLLFSEQRSKLQLNYLTDVRSGNVRKDEVRAQYQVEF